MGQTLFIILSDADKSKMMKEARERVSRTLRERIQESVVDEARDLMARAESLAKTRSAHPLARQITQQTAELRHLIDSGDNAALEDKIDDLLRMITELEAAG